MDMSDGVKQKRPYDSSRRKEQAQQTRRAILQAAYELFVEQGYGRTTMAAIGERAGVAMETVYAIFSNKPTLLKGVWDLTIGGDDQEIAFHERPKILELRREPDLARRLEMMAHIARITNERTVPFLRALTGAAGSEPVAAEMVEEIDRQRLVGITLMAKEAQATGQLAVSEAEFRDVVWSTNRGDLWHLLVQKRGWEPDRFEQWLGELWKRVLVRDRDAGTAPSSR